MKEEKDQKQWSKAFPWKDPCQKVNFPGWSSPTLAEFSLHQSTLGLLLLLWLLALKGGTCVQYSKGKRVTGSGQLRWRPPNEEEHFCKCKQEPGLLTQRKTSFLGRFCSSKGSRHTPLHRYHHSSQGNTEPEVPTELASEYRSTWSKTWVWL